MVSGFFFQKDLIYVLQNIIEKAAVTVLKYHYILLNIRHNMVIVFVQITSNFDPQNLSYMLAFPCLNVVLQYFYRWIFKAMYW